MKSKHIYLTAILLILSVIGLAQNIPARPVPPRLVNDFANILTDKQERALEYRLVSYNDSTSTQICVVTVNDLDGTTAADFAYQLGEKWGVGHKESNGVVILVKPKRGNTKGDVTIQVGYGLEPYVTDAMSKRIIEKEMIPYFKDGDYYKGIDMAVDIIIGLASGAFSAEAYGNDDSDFAEAIIGIAMILFIIVILVAFSKGGNGAQGKKGGFWRTLFWISLLSGRGGGGRGGSSGSGFGGGSRRNGGFGGFGGGHFGGGGASGSW